MELEQVAIENLTPHPRNARAHPQNQLEHLQESLDEYDWVRNIVTTQDGTILIGHGIVAAAKRNGHKTVPVYRTQLEPDDPKAIKLMVLENSVQDLAIDDEDQLAVLLRDIEETEGLAGTGYDEAALQDLLSELQAEEFGDSAQDPEEASSLTERFGAPPFSILDARQGYWQERKQQWLALGIQSEVGRGADLSYSGQEGLNELKAGLLHDSGTSVFDPVLCELMYSWFCPPNGEVLDPFAGGSVRGVVAAALDRQYSGIDLSERQIEANHEQWEHIEPLLADINERVPPQPQWLVGNSANIDELATGEYDFVFSCPPYVDLEIYGDEPGELSQMAYPEFRETYSQIITESTAMLKDNRFAAFVVGEARNGDGDYYGFVPDTIKAFQRAGLRLYNEAILVTRIGSLPVRVPGQFTASRKLGKTHQNVLIFVKGDAGKAVDNLQSEPPMQLPEESTDEPFPVSDDGG